MVQRLVIIRGLPGSGKSTKAKRLKTPQAIHVEADMFFVKNGVYKFDRRDLKLAHTWCQTVVMAFLEDHQEVWVSNTFSTIKEIQPYIDMAKRMKICWNVWCCNGRYKSIHNVPDDTIERMANHWENFPGEFHLNNGEPQ